MWLLCARAVIPDSLGLMLRLDVFVFLHLSRDDYSSPVMLNLCIIFLTLCNYLIEIEFVVSCKSFLFTY